jgi:hypothetical protein
MERHLNPVLSLRVAYIHVYRSIDTIAKTTFFLFTRSQDVQILQDLEKDFFATAVLSHVYCVSEKNES